MQNLQIHFENGFEFDDDFCAECYCFILCTPTYLLDDVLGNPVWSESLHTPVKAV